MKGLVFWEHEDPESLVFSFRCIVIYILAVKQPHLAMPQKQNMEKD